MTAEVWPDGIFPNGCKFYIAEATGIFEQPFTFSPQAYEMLGVRRWVSELTFQRRNAAQSGAIDAMLARLRGGAGEVLVPDFRRARTKDVIRGLNALGVDDDVDGIEKPFADSGFVFADTGYGWALPAPFTLTADVSAGAKTLQISGFIPGAKVFGPGDVFSVDDRLYLVQDRDGVVADASGIAAVSISPAARQAHSAGASCLLRLPVCKMRVVDNSAAENETGAGQFSDYQILFAEV